METKIKENEKIKNHSQKTESSASRITVSIILIVLILVGGSLAFFGIVKSKKEPENRETKIQIAQVETMTLTRKNHTMKIRGYGNTTPFQTLNLQPEVNGAVTWIADSFDIGQILKKGEKVIQIEKTKYEFACKTNKAAVNQLGYSIEQLKKEKENTLANIDIMNKTVALSKKEFQRNQRLLKKKSVSQSSVDKLESAYLGQLASLQSQKNILNTLDPRMEQLNAQLLAAQSHLDSSMTDLDKTAITMPFDAVIVEKNVSIGNVVSAGSKLGVLYSIDKARIEVPVSGENFHWLINTKKTDQVSKKQNLAYSLYNKAYVKTENNGFSSKWPARLARTGGRLSTATRTMNLIVEVDDPFNVYKDSKNPPLAAGTFCRVDFMGRTMENVFLIPRKAYYQNGTVKFLKDNKIVIKEIKVLASQEDQLIVRDDTWEDSQELVITNSVLLFKGMEAEKVQPKSQTQVEAE